MNGSDADRHNQKKPGLSPGPENVRFGHTHTCKINYAAEYARGLPRRGTHDLKSVEFQNQFMPRSQLVITLHLVNPDNKTPKGYPARGIKNL